MPMKKSKRERNSERKRERKLVPKDVTISDSADAPKVVSKLKKFTGVGPEIIKSEMTWDQMNSDSTDHEIVEEFNPDGTKSFVYKKKRNRSKSEASIDDRPGLVYPEIVWYHLSPYIKPEDVGHFAGINRSTYAITKTEKFWKGLYKQYCENRPRLPEKLRIENSYTVYGLRQRVIRALFHTYNLFFKRVMHEATQDSKPHDLVKRRCVNVWFSEGPTYWYVYFKFKKSFVTKTAGRWEVDFLEELGKVDANPEEDCQVLQACHGQTSKPVFCTKIPDNALPCMGNPQLVAKELSSQCTREEAQAVCNKYTCTLKSAGWLEERTQKINKKNVEAYFDQYAKENPGFHAAVQALKSTCLSGNLLPQGIHLDCPAYDLSHCIFASFLKNAGRQWQHSEACQATKTQVEACPACPEECYAPAIPIGSCNACYATPPTSG
ncbi:uncharacterized protein LOC106134109 isoform X1 [Amyelois transitella]|uniref:uncharacterized protein LOC106134109 isoform X1 n=1 Tax=Amyelois transitella TaxID=680683 RepID=UPI00067D44A8|nr:uncharacterized protein LOC106134109 isoform X1 [Amyelois transitella]